LYNCWLLVDVLVRDIGTVMIHEPEMTAKRVLAAMTQYLRPGNLRGSSPLCLRRSVSGASGQSADFRY